MTKILERERHQLKSEYQQLLAHQYSMREQAELRQKTLQERLQARWRMASVVTSLGLVASLVAFQLLFLFLFHVHLTPAVSLSIVAPIGLCVVLALAAPVGLLRYMHLTAPHKKKANRR